MDITRFAMKLFIYPHIFLFINDDSFPYLKCVYSLSLLRLHDMSDR